MLLNLDTVPPFYKNYVKQIEETDVLQALRFRIQDADVDPLNTCFQG
jgi:hypothetical protein